MKVKLWTIQDENGWNELQTKEILVAKQQFVEPDFKDGYDWMKIQMNKRIGRPNEKGQYPIWAWYQSISANKRKPDLRASAHLPRKTMGYRIEIEKDQKDILLSDFVLWHWPLSYKTYIANSEIEANEFEKRQENTEFDKLSKKEKELIEKSWEKIFDMDFDLEYYTLPFKEKKIQATFWELQLKDVIKVDKFIAK